MFRAAIAVFARARTSKHPAIFLHDAVKKTVRKTQRVSLFPRGLFVGDPHCIQERNAYPANDSGGRHELRPIGSLIVSFPPAECDGISAIRVRRPMCHPADLAFGESRASSWNRPGGRPTQGDIHVARRSKEPIAGELKKITRWRNVSLTCARNGRAASYLPSLGRSTV